MYKHKKDWEASVSVDDIKRMIRNIGHSDFNELFWWMYQKEGRSNS
jgi:hypothetical protein